MGDSNAAQKAMQELGQDEVYNFLTGGVRKVAPRVGKKAQGVLNVMPTQTAGMGEKSFGDIWKAASTEQRNKWLGEFEPTPPKDRYEYLLNLWNSGQIDGIRHNDSMRKLLYGVE